MKTVEIVEKIERAFGREEVFFLMQRFGLEKLSDLEEFDRDRFNIFAEAVLKYGVRPSASWTDNIPTKMVKL